MSSAESKSAAHAALADALQVDVGSLGDALRAAIADVDGADPGTLTDHQGDDSDNGMPPARRASAAKTQARLAKDIMGNILRNYDGASSYIRSLQFKKERNFHEARRLAQVIDSARSANIDLSLDFMEMLLRNLAGICEVDKYNNPGLLEQIEFAPPQQLIPRDFFRAFTKDAKRDADMRKAATKPKTGTPGGGNGRAGGT